MRRDGHGTLPTAQDDALQRKIVAYYRAGVSKDGLMQRYGISEPTLRAILRKHGVERRKIEA